MEVVKYSKIYEEDVKNLLVELQEYIVSIDDWKLNIIAPEYREKYFEKIIQSNINLNGVIFLAIENNKIVGVISGHLIQYDEFDKYDYICPKSGLIEELIVSKTCRSVGVGSKLITNMENYFKSLGCEYCHVNVFEPNIMGKNFYNKNNYTVRMRSLSKKL